MSGKLKAGTMRTSYVEDSKTDSVLTLLAAIKKTTKSVLIREATAAFLAKEDKEGLLRSLAGKLATNLPDESSERAKAELDTELQNEAARVIELFRSRQ
jgi:hypothetical protein